MKYFTQDLLKRFQADDDDIADAAQGEWDRKSEEYRRHLGALRNHLPRDFRTMLDDYRLHDAHVVARFASLIGDKRLYFIEIRPEGSPDHPLLLTYVLDDGPQPPDLHGGCYWLYDEVDIVSRTAPLVFSHAITFTDGTELALYFTDFQLAPVPRGSQESHVVPEGQP